MEIEKSSIRELNKKFWDSIFKSIPRKTHGIPNHSVKFTVIGAGKIKTRNYKSRDLRYG